MQVATQVSIWGITGLMAVLTIFFNLFIFVMSMRSYTLNKHWTPCETIITALSLASGSHQLLCFLWMTMVELDQDCRLKQSFYSLIILTVFSLKFTMMWTITLLNYYYSTKLILQHVHCFTTVQAIFWRHITLMVLAIPLCAISSSLPMLTVLLPQNNTVENPDCSSITPDDKPGLIYYCVYLVLSDILPGLLMVKCCLSITIYLASHLKQMTASTNSSHTPKPGSQMRVIYMTLASVVVFLCFLVVDLYVHYKVMVNKENIIVLSILFTSIYTTFSAMILIYGKKSFWKALVHSYNICMDTFFCLSCLKLTTT